MNKPGFLDVMTDGVDAVTGWAALDELPEDLQARQFQEQLDHASMYRQCFSDPAGRYVLQDLYNMFKKGRIVLPEDDNQFKPGIRQGQADVVDRILFLIEFANTGGGRPTGQQTDNED